MNNLRIALVNPPGSSKYIRDYYTSLIAKANYYYPPIDFVWLSASLERPVKVFDAIAEDMKPEELLKEISDFDPSHIFYLISGLSLDEDLSLIEIIKKRFAAKVIAMGDICRIAPEFILSKCPHVDAVLRSFACTDIMSVLKSGFSEERPVPGWAFRHGCKAGEETVNGGSSGISIGIPKWDIFPLKRYRFPFALSALVGTMLTDYGCPFKCSYCSIGTLGWRLRSLDEVIGEIDLLCSLGVKEVHFRDQTFGVDKERTKSIIAHLKLKKLNWSCFSRVDIVSRDMLSKMKDAGCHTVIFGIESGDYVFRQKYGKDIKDDLLVSTLKLCSELKICTVGTFIIGLPGEGQTEALKTIKFAISLPLDYASFNIAVPRIGSALRLSDEDAASMKENACAGYKRDELGFMPREESVRLAALAAKMFYVRPAYILRRLSKISSPSVLLNEFKIGCNLLFGAIKH